MKLTGGWSGSSATVSIGSGAGNRRAGRGQWAGHASPVIGRRGATPLDRAFRHVAGDRSEAIEPAFADAIGERVDQAGDIGLRLLDQRGNRLLWRQRLGERGGKAHDLDAEARIDRFDLVAEQPGQALHVAHRQRRADPDRLDAVIDAVQEQIEPPRAEAFGLQRLAELRRRACRCSGRWFPVRRSARRRRGGPR